MWKGVYIWASLSPHVWTLHVSAVMVLENEKSNGVGTQTNLLKLKQSELLTQEV